MATSVSRTRHLARTLYPDLAVPRSRRLSLQNPQLAHKSLSPALIINRRFQSTGGTGGGNDYQLGPSQEVQPQPNTQSWGDSGDHGDDADRRRAQWRQTAYRMMESAATTGASLAILGLAGFGYHK
ncbi:hypothetical protein ABW19_dt0202915 [Dactylella cylindrospora]|nr:hypothetical protein ABW19_dt0202915 [Dactylella cylindrospora]